MQSKQPGEAFYTNNVELERKWNWIGHILRRDNSITRHAIKWNLQDNNRRDQPAII